MTKRRGSIETNLTKKTRTEHNDDWDDSELDDCLVLATQICEQSVSNISKLPTYEDFEKPAKLRKVCSSTQKSSNVFPPNVSQKKVCVQETDNLLSEHFKALQEKYEAKEGEVTILRNNFNVLKANSELELNKKKDEWMETIKLSTQKNNALKSELEFKDLEIANLKQKLIEVNKTTKLEMSFSLTQLLHNEDRKTDNSSNKKILMAEIEDLNPTAITYFPFSGNNYFNGFGYSKKENYFLKRRDDQICLHLIPHVHEDTNKTLTDFERLNLDDEKCLAFPKVYKEIQSYLSSSHEFLNKVDSLPAIIKIIGISYFFMESLNSYLEEVSKTIQLKDIRQADNLYLENKFNSDNQEISLMGTESVCDNEIGISARQCITLIASIFPYNNFVKRFIIENINIKTGSLDEVLRLNCEKFQQQKHYFLTRILNIIKMIGKTRKAHVLPGLLLATINLLESIFLTGNLNQVRQLVVDITKEIVFARPNFPVLEKISSFIAVASCNSKFVNELCKKTTCETVQKIQKEGITCFNSNACILQMYCTLVETTLKKSKDLHLDLCCNVIKIVSNILASNSTWIYYQENEHNDCLCMVSRIFIDISYTLLQTVEKGFCAKKCHFKPGDYESYIESLKISLKVIHMLNFYYASNLIVKYIGTYSQYKYIIDTISSMRHELNLSEFENEMLETIQVSDEDINMPKQNFANISLWNTN